MFSGKLECVRPLQNLLSNAGGLQLPSNGGALMRSGKWECERPPRQIMVCDRNNHLFPPYIGPKR
jgi:hypothetical protein